MDTQQLLDSLICSLSCLSCSLSCLSCSMPSLNCLICSLSCLSCSVSWLNALSTLCIAFSARSPSSIARFLDSAALSTLCIAFSARSSSSLACFLDSDAPYTHWTAPARPPMLLLISVCDLAALFTLCTVYSLSWLSCSLSWNQLFSF